MGRFSDNLRRGLYAFMAGRNGMDALAQYALGAGIAQHRRPRDGERALRELASQAPGGPRAPARTLGRTQGRQVP